jgi:enamine deaminase RidA (YjgF/YER057c/UK114 family)
MQRTSINPWPWSLQVGYSQAEAVGGHTTQLLLFGQAAIDADGKPQFAGDLGAQLGLALDNLHSLAFFMPGSKGPLRRGRSSASHASPIPK